jgi:nitroimidazol reductase NimA-like FMN-containing flavoprotein (pyridoxamine 5'-phosphate oxidase superfamily)
VKSVLPEKIKEALRQNQVCCLGTLNGEEPYLSLMLFTFIEDEEILIMSSQTDSTKIRNMKSNPKTAVLIQTDSNSANSVGITLSGTVRIENGERAVNLLNIHRKAHSLNSDFISGNHITVFSFQPRTAIMANQQDQVTYWSEE